LFITVLCVVGDEQNQVTLKMIIFRENPFYSVTLPRHPLEALWIQWLGEVRARFLERIELFAELFWECQYRWYNVLCYLWHPV